VVNLDMIGYNTGQPVFDAYAREGTSPGASESRQLAEVFSNTIATHNLDLIPRRIDLDDYPLKYGSDQWSFLKQGYPAILVIEDYAGEDFTPYYHTVSDTIDTLDLDYYADVTRASIATLAHLGQPLPSDATGWLSGTVQNQKTGEPLSATTITAFWPTYGYTFTATSDAHGAYSATLPVGSYTITVRSSADYQALITQTQIITDAITAQDIGLRPWIRLYLPHVVRET
jgi:Zn-dependent M28 family amino/carboxypeptidase